MVAFFCFLIFFFSLSQSCPCENATFCERLKQKLGPRQIFGWHVGSGAANGSWLHDYDWFKLTTVAMFSSDQEVAQSGPFVCHAHGTKTRVVLSGNWGASPADIAQLRNSTARSLWVQGLLEKAAGGLIPGFMFDGVNIDVEVPITSKETRAGLTALVQECSVAFHRQLPGSQVTFDAAWSPDNVDDRAYDYAAIAASVDHMMIMAYDIESQYSAGPQQSECIARPNSPINKVQLGVQKFVRALRIPPHKLVLGVPWYGYGYTCLSFDADGNCIVERKSYFGSQCSDAAGKEFNYDSIIDDFLPLSSTGVRRGPFGSPYFDFTRNGQAQRVMYDDPTSLKLKYTLSLTQNLSGLAIWNINAAGSHKIMWSTLE